VECGHINVAEYGVGYHFKAGSFLSVFDNPYQVEERKVNIREPVRSAKKGKLVAAVGKRKMCLYMMYVQESLWPIEQSSTWMKCHVFASVVVSASVQQ
jgi:hypothetical protein